MQRRELGRPKLSQLSGAQRMAENATLLVDEVFPEQPVRHWVLNIPYPLRFLFASETTEAELVDAYGPDIGGIVLGVADNKSLECTLNKDSPVSAKPREVAFCAKRMPAIGTALFPRRRDRFLPEQGRW